MKRPHPRVATLDLYKIERVADLVGTRKPREASGVTVRDGLLLVVSDNTAMLAVLDADLTAGREVRLEGGRGRDYEDLAADPAGGRLFVVVEELPGGRPFRSLVEEYDDRYRLVAAKEFEASFEDENKGVEGIAALRHDGRLHLLGLGEDDGGRIGVYTEAADRWERVATIQLPHPFEDYAGVAVEDDRIAVVSQRSSALWIGRLDPRTWTVDAGTVYAFPPRFTAVEGVAFLGANRVVVATDQRDDKRRRDTDQSVAVFDVP